MIGWHEWWGFAEGLHQHGYGGRGGRLYANDAGDDEDSFIQRNTLSLPEGAFTKGLFLFSPCERHSLWIWHAHMISKFNSKLWNTM